MVGAMVDAMIDAMVDAMVDERLPVRNGWGSNRQPRHLPYVARLQ